MKNWLRDKIIFPCLEMLPSELTDKLKMLGTCCFGSGWGYYFLSGFANEFENVSEEEVISLYSGVSERSLRVLRDYLKFNCLSVYFCKYMDVKENDNIIIPVDKIFPGLKDKLRLEKNCAVSLSVKAASNILRRRSAVIIMD